MQAVTVSCWWTVERLFHARGSECGKLYEVCHSVQSNVLVMLATDSLFKLQVSVVNVCHGLNLISQGKAALNDIDMSSGSNCVLLS